ncbi:MAG: MoxR family ATPase [bacterium]|nr:MoxR family ATPase [bacterium]
MASPEVGASGPRGSCPSRRAARAWSSCTRWPRCTVVPVSAGRCWSAWGAASRGGHGCPGASTRICRRAGWPRRPRPVRVWKNRDWRTRCRPSRGRKDVWSASVRCWAWRGTWPGSRRKFSVGIDRVHEVSRRLVASLSSIVRGQDAAVRDLVIALLSGGHVLLEGPPGLGKTLLVRTLASLVRAEFRRIQFTPDLMPADVTGTTIFRPQTGEFEFQRGPLFTQLLLADEINRTPPKTQAALLEAMQERQVTLDGHTHALPEPFLVVATQNPIEYEGTYPLPEAQLDRFLMKVVVGYPDGAAEREILDAHAARLELTPRGAEDLTPVIDAEEIRELRDAASKTFVEESVLDYIAAICRASREHRSISLGASSRAMVLLLFAAKVGAAVEGRDFVRPDDVKSVAPAVLRHRLILRPESEVEGVGPDHVIRDLLQSVALPRGADDGPEQP